ncbi:MAG: bifunctional serine/threonine-protein kinase/formylglycine-generating enzyme family protein [Planctomycetia bacterium]|nr:bifunctional serine/threonine-protein kinase/formylglycine-generating enzyme family protein [Planctomycetia bacterium]
MSDDSKQNLSLNSMPTFGNYENSDYEMDAELQELVSGMILAEKYRLENQAGQGGMGVVWKAFDTVGKRWVALKFVPKEMRHVNVAMEQVETAFQTIQALNHQYICPVYALERDAKFGYYVVMKWLNGMSLAEFRQQREFRQEMILPILKPLSEALDYAHKRGVIHRDVKPGNIFLLTPQNGELEVQLIDFGIAAEIPQADTTFHTFLQLKTSGTMAYMPPEQWEGDPQEQDGRTDQYALATVAYELYAGHLPFVESNERKLISRKLQKRPEKIKSVPAHVNSALQKALAKDRRERFPSCVDFVKALSAPAPAAPSFVIPTPPPPPETKSVEELAEELYRKMKAEEEMKKLREDAERLARERFMAEKKAGDNAERRSFKDPKPGERMLKTINGVQFAFRWCPAGSFMMGSPEVELGRRGNETQHRVTLTKGFWMLETQVTQAMWESVMGNNPSRFRGYDLPVEKVSWKDCQEFCRKLRSQRLNIQLPTEAQWEYACRAGTTTAFHFGDTLNGDKANCDGNYPYGTNTTGMYLAKTTPVKSYSPNAWGLYDMHGNVWEWCADWYDEDYYQKSPTNDPTGPASGSIRVVRGGSWNSYAKICRSACRNNGTLTSRDIRIGFRIILIP